MKEEKLKELNDYAPIVDCDISEIQKYSVCVGDRVSLPEFTVPAVIIDGENEMDFEEHTIKDNAIIYKITNKHIYLVFEHCLFQSAIDLNEQTEWEKTQLRQYLNTPFKKAMNDAGIDAKKVSLLSLEEVSGDEEKGDEPLPYFRYAKNRIAVDLEEKESWAYWLKKVDCSNCYCSSYGYGYSYYGDTSDTDDFVRPCFAVEKLQGRTKTVQEISKI